MSPRATFAAFLLPLALALAAACDSASTAERSGGDAGPASAGTRSSGGNAGRGGASGSGGSTSNGARGGATAVAGTTGVSNGGTASGGTASAGAANGGTASAGASNGGTSSGGAPSGGAPSGGASNGGSGAGAAQNGTIVPLYGYPTDPAWKAIASAKASHPNVDVIAIVNPDNGPGTAVDATFTKGIAALVTAGIVPIGYVSTNYTKRGEAAVKADVDRWHTEYPATRGIFFDEQSNTAGDEAFYRDVSNYAKSLGLSFTVGNPGTSIPASFLDTVDVMLIYESAGTPALSTLSRYASGRSHYGIIPYAASFDATYVKSASKDVRYQYITDDDLPNPWDTLPAFFEPLLAALEP